MDINTTKNKYSSPNIRGLSIRRLIDKSDFGLMAAIIQASKEVDQLERVDTGEDLARSFSHQKNFDPFKDIFFVEVDGDTIGCSRVRWRAEQDGKYIYNHWGLLAPKWRRKGIGRHLLYFNQRRLIEIASEHPKDAQRCFEAFAADTEVGANVLLTNENYQAVRYFSNMVRPDLENIQQADIPPGLEVQTVQPEHYQKICDASREAFRDHWGFSEASEPTVEEWKDDPNFDPTLWQVAWDGDEVAGMILNFIDKRENAEYNRKRGWTENISVRRPWRRQGLARGLLSKSLRMLKEIGMEEAALDVDTENLSGALRLYESMGFKAVKRNTTYQKEFEIGD
jgi:GNAT superfamily N-acetyltransferase